MQREIGYIRQASGVERIRYWSGGNLYPHLLEAATCAGLEMNSDWKNPPHADHRLFPGGGAPLAAFWQPQRRGRARFCDP